ncbi:MAG: polysulfide reductase NrfD [Candidatus Heimdallarchaeota archaeon]|nr:polysulfide reductase NrfD [Candidatus Heimdallarchaeota archaeon]
MATVQADTPLKGRAVVEKSMFETGPKTKILMLILIMIILNGAVMYILQLINGLSVTGLTKKVFWGMYITNFVFFIGVSHAGTLISAILRVTGAGWRTPITRLAEEITALALIFGATSVLIDMGRLNRVGNVFIHSNLQSPLIWDVTSLTFYLLGSLLFLYLPIIPDAAYYRDNLPEDKWGWKQWRKKFYTIISVGFRGTERQYEILEKNISRMSYVIIPVAVSVHTVVSWIMSMSWRVGWNSTIFGPYFVIGAIFSGLASLLMAMVLFTHFYKLHEYLTKDHFISLSKLFLVFTIMYFYFTLSEYLTGGYKSEHAEIDLLQELYYGQYAGMFWYFVIGGLVIPIIAIWLMIAKKDKLSFNQVLGIIFVTSTMVNIGMWIKRYIIVVPVLARETVQEGWHTYTPNYTEWSIFAAQTAGFVLLYIILSKLVPIISLWEVEHEQALHGEEH